MLPETLKTGRLAMSIYITGLQSFPIPTIDFVVKKGKKFLLIQRNEGAFCGTWFVAGGRQNRGEETLEGVLRVAQRELGLRAEEILDVRFSHTQDVHNPASETPAGNLPEWHSIWQFHVIEVNDSFGPKLDSTSNTSIWTETLEGLDVPEPVERALRKAGMIK
jgi:ADP-ribose pyrophosphatase YjhB (NUDIX family)